MAQVLADLVTHMADEGPLEPGDAMVIALERVTADVDRGVLPVPDDALGALRLLGAYFISSQGRFDHVTCSPLDFAVTLWLIAFRPGYSLPHEWLYSNCDMRRAAEAAGATESMCPLPMPIAICKALVGPAPVEYPKMSVTPSVEEAYSALPPVFSATAVFRSADDSGERMAEERLAVDQDGTRLRAVADRRGSDAILSDEIKCPARRRSTQTRKITDELAVGRAFIRSYNAQRQANFSEPTKHPDEQVCDIAATCPETGASLEIQVVKVDERYWRVLAKDAAYSGKQTAPEAVRLLRGALAKKGKYDRSAVSQMVLLLDAGLSAIDTRTLQQFSATHASELGSLGFREIWYVSRPFPLAVQLHPLAAHGDAMHGERRQQARVTAHFTFGLGNPIRSIRVSSEGIITQEDESD